MKYELMGEDVKLKSFNRFSTGRIVDTIFERSLYVIATITYAGVYLDNFTLKENVMSHPFEEPVDKVTWLKIKQPGTYTIYFDLIYSSSVSFE